MNERDDRRHTLAELAATSGVPARTIRYYIARGILPGPASVGRAADYGTEHLERLARIHDLQRRGLTLAQVARELDGAAPSVPEPTPCWQYPVDDGVVVMVRGGLPPWRVRAIRRAVAEMAAALKSAREEGDPHDDDR